MMQLQSLELWDALPGMAELQLPPSLTELHIDRWVLTVCAQCLVPSPGS